MIIVSYKTEIKSQFLTVEILIKNMLVFRIFLSFQFFTFQFGAYLPYSVYHNSATLQIRLYLTSIVGICCMYINCFQKFPFLYLLTNIAY